MWDCCFWVSHLLKKRKNTPALDPYVEDAFCELGAVEDDQDHTSDNLSAGATVTHGHSRQQSQTNTLPLYYLQAQEMERKRKQLQQIDEAQLLSEQLATPLLGFPHSPQ